MSRGWAVGAALFVLVASPLDGWAAEPATRAQEVRSATEKVLSDPRFQRTKPDGTLAPKDEPSRPPSAPKEPRHYEPTQASGVSAVLLWTLGGIFALGLLLVLARELALARRRRARKKSGRGEGFAELILESHAQALPASLARARALAAAQRFDEAAHELLTATMGYLKALTGFSLEPSHTSREVLAKAPLDETLRGSLGELVFVVEVSLFGEQPIGDAEYQRCERAFLTLHDRLGHGG